MRKGDWIDNYFKEQEESEIKYGNKTVVLMQKGTFYEIYQYEIDDVNGNKKSVGHARPISEILNFVLTSSNSKKPHSESNPYLIGMPCVTYNRHKELILKNDYTIVRMDEIKDQYDKKKGKERKVVEVISPSMNIDSNNLGLTNNIISIYIDCQKKKHKFEDYVLVSGIAMVDVTTGKNCVCEAFSKETNGSNAIQEIYRFIYANSPKEIIFNIDGIDEDEKYEKFLKRIFDLQNYKRISFFWNKVDKEYLKIQYQIQLFNKLFINRNDGEIVNDFRKNKNIIEELNLAQMQYGRISYILLLNYCIKYNENILNNLKRPDPQWIDDKNHLILTFNAIEQLDVFPRKSSKKDTGKYNSLFSLIDFTKTCVGKRYLKSVLANPLRDSKILNERYDRIEALLESEDLYNKLEELLKGIPDIERYHKKISLLNISPYEFGNLMKTYQKIIGIYGLLKSSKYECLKSMLFSKEVVESFNLCIKECFMAFDPVLLSKAKIVDDMMIFGECPSKDFTILLFNKKSEDSKNRLDKICNHLNSLLPVRGEEEVPWINLMYPPTKNEEDLEMGCKFLITSKAKALALNMKDYDVKLCGEISSKVLVEKKSMITSNLIDGLTNSYNDNLLKVENMCYEQFVKLIEKMSKNFEFFSALDEFIAMVDFTWNGCKVAKKYKYYKPVIDDSAEHSFLQAEKMRHPFCEHLIDHEYISNDISLGKEPLSIALFGCNGSGKSTFNKSLCLNIILAQTGNYVPCKLIYKPYSNILTRLSGNDDILKGKSSFAIEMIELRTILNEASKNSLVVADEMTRATEQGSGQGITIATIEELIKRNASFIFSSHNHQIVKTKYIKRLIDNGKLRVCHLSSYYDEVNDTLIYERKLKESEGNNNYGISVAKSYHIDPYFIDRANQIRRELEGETNTILNVKKSRYNKDLYLDCCAICGENSAKLHSHHINEQHKSDINGFIGDFHKNKLFNIIALCESCHNNLHISKKEILGKQTINGIIFEKN